MKIKVLIWKIQYYGFVGNVYADLGLPRFSYWANIGPSRAHFRSKNMGFFFKWFFSMFDKSARSADINEKKLGKVVYNLF